MEIKFGMDDLIRLSATLDKEFTSGQLPILTRKSPVLVNSLGHSQKGMPATP